MAQSKKNPFVLYSIVVNYLLYVFILTVGGYLLGRFVLIKTIIAGGIFATIGAILGIILFIYGMLKLGKDIKDEKK